MTTTPRVLVRAAERGPDFPSVHPYNPRSEMHGWLLSRPAGMARIAVNLAFLPAGRESAIFHLHHREEEWMFNNAGGAMGGMTLIHASMYPFSSCDPRELPSR